MVIDFSIENDPEIFVLVRKWLMTCLNVDNAEPTHSESNLSFNKKPLVIGASMHDTAIHDREAGPVYILTLAGIENAADSAHD